jgi:hypothetical protein
MILGGHSASDGRDATFDPTKSNAGGRPAGTRRAPPCFRMAGSAERARYPHTPGGGRVRATETARRPNGSGGGNEGGPLGCGLRRAERDFGKRPELAEGTACMIGGALREAEG